MTLNTTVFYILYILVELPSNWVLKKMRANRWLPFLICTWGMVTTLSGLVQNFAGLTAVRMILGMCEGGLLPGMVRLNICFQALVVLRGGRC